MKTQFVFALALVGACSSGSAPSGDLGVPADLTFADLTPPLPLGNNCLGTVLVENYTCSNPNDYHPRDSAPAHLVWPACVSDDNAFHLTASTAPPSVARVAQFESVAPTLWGKATLPDPADFTAAVTLLSASGGIVGQLAAVEDKHYPPVPGSDSCASAATTYPDRCAGAAKLMPTVTELVQQGKAGNLTHVQAERLEATLLWYFYLSATWETANCDTTASGDGNCDAQWADSTGGQARDQVTGLAGYVSKLGIESKDRIYDGNLAIRCWRDFTTSGNPRPDLFNFGAQQLDRALIHGLALVARQRFTQLGCATGQYKEGHFQFLKILVGFLDRASRAGGHTAEADVLKAQINATADTVDVTAALAALDTLYPACP